MFTFDASSSYSLSSRVASTQWVITDAAGNRVDTVETKVLKKKFVQPGLYSAKLTVIDELGNQSYDTQQFTVGSTPPVPSFTIAPSSDLLYPSRFILDATPTYDLDVSNNSDALKYRWTFSSNDQVTITSSEENGRKIVATFNSPGTYKVRLLVEDSFGESVEIEKSIQVISTLRPEVVITPVVGQRGTEVSFVTKTNKPVAFYEWDYGDGVVERESSPMMTHTYKKAGVYQVKILVLTTDGEENSLTRQVFVGQQDEPTLAYEVYKTKDVTMTKTATCENASGDAVPAYQVTRYENMMIDLGPSKNVQGTEFGLTYQFQPQNDEVYSKKSLSYSFPLMGCTWVDAYVEDNAKGITVSDRIWFKIENALPELDNLLVDFPQPGGGNSIGVGLADSSTPQRDIFGDETIDPIVVKLSAR
ncbi:MAG: PKD domain-containing protein [Candidatus Peribacteria bacterium]|nr:MAG: PKD domain-containing protein [Candidatus Peribacteria bacterium]